jgi:thiamine-phosphate diphosphorylase
VIICLVSDRKRLCNNRPLVDRSEAEHRCLLEQVRYAVEAGVDLIQLREHDLEAAELCELAGWLLEETRGSTSRLVINDRLDVAIVSGADGVHLRQSSVGVEAARRLAPQGFLVGCSVHSVDEATVASGADYLIAGTVFASASKPDITRYSGISGLKAVVEATDTPVLAIGGVTLDRLGPIAATGAVGVAAIGWFMSDSSASAPGCRAIPLKRLVEDARRRFDSLKPCS